MVKVMMLGPLVVHDDGGTRAAWLGHKAQDLLVLLLASPQRTVLREVAAEALWPESTAEASRKAMRQVLWHLHKELDADVPAEQRLLVVEGEVLRINPTRRLWVDAEEFVAAARLATALEVGAVSAAQAVALGRAAELYRGTLHAGCYDEWCVVPRARLEDRALTLMDLLSRVHEHRGAINQAIAWGQRLLDVEPAHERTHRRLMRLFAASGDRTRALRQLAECRRTLGVTLGVQPDGRTEALARAITADRVPAVGDETWDGSATGAAVRAVDGAATGAAVRAVPEAARRGAGAGRPFAVPLEPDGPATAPAPRPSAHPPAPRPSAASLAAEQLAPGLELLRGELTELRHSVEAIGDRLREAAV